MNKNHINFIKSNIYYLNLSELKNICNDYNIYYLYYAEEKTNPKSLKQTNVIIRKKHIMKNIIKFIENKPIKKYIIKKEQISTNKRTISKPNLSTIIFFNEYKFELGKTLLKNIVKNKYEACVSHIMLYKIWQHRKTYTYAQFAEYYDLHYDKIKNMDHIEWQYIDFLRKQNNPKDWINVRTNISNKVIKLIKRHTLYL